MNIMRLLLLSLLFSTLVCSKEALYSLIVSVKDLRNSEGLVQFSLYNEEGTIPDEKFQLFYQQLKNNIKNKTATVAFKDLPKGHYAVNILHDEDSDGKIKKGFILPKEGIGFSQFDSIGLTNKPSFKKAKILLESDHEIQIKVLYF